MNPIQRLLTENIGLWTGADTAKKTGRGRASGSAGTVYGIKKLRELILELAVRGKLVPQDSDDEPANALLARIREEKARLVLDGKIKKDKPLAAITDDERPFELPQGWEWSTLATISQVNPRNIANDNSTVSFVPMTMIGARFNSSHDQDIRLWKEVKQAFTHFAEGDIGIAKITPCFENSKACVFSGLQNKIGAGTTELHIIRPINSTLAPRYVLAYLKSPQFLLVGETRMTGTAGQKRLPKEFVESNPFPLPPLAEQHRIVAKIDELMALCDQLEAGHVDAVDAHETLVSHLLATLTGSKDSADFSASWQRIAAHFDMLFTTEASIDALKQTLLQLAVMGKLVPQDPSDEPASALLERIQVEKAKLVFEGHIKKDKPLATIPGNDKPFELPQGWEWTRMINCAKQITDGEHLTPERTIDATQIPLVTAKNVRDGNMDYSVTDYVPLDIATKCWNRCRPEPNDILIVSVGATIGRLTIIDDHQDMVIVRSVTLIKPLLINVKYLALGLRSPTLQEYIWGGVKKNAQPCLYLSVSNSLPIPVPPLLEQERIVAKVDELMALCDRMKKRIADAGALQRKLADVIVAQAVA